MSIQALATYRPPWDAGGSRSCGPDEDVVTLAVAAGLPALAAADREVQSVVLVTREPDFLEASTGAVIAAALGLPPETAVEERLGGGPAALAALAGAPEGTLVVAVSSAAPAGAAAAVVGGGGSEIVSGGGLERSLPARVRQAAAAGVDVYEDPRLVREVGSRPSVSAVLNGQPPAMLTGVPKGDLRRFGVEAPVNSDRVEGAAEPLFALAALIEAGRTGRLVAVEGASAFALDVGAGAAKLVRAEGGPVTAEPSDPLPGQIPLSLPAYARAFESKVGLRAARCVCGTLSYPPRLFCLTCGRSGETTLEALPRTCEVYTVVTIRTPVPGMAAPYSLAIASLDGVDVRVLVHVTGAPAGSVRIGDRGELVFRRIALRQGVPDYGYAFSPAEVAA